MEEILIETKNKTNAKAIAGLCLGISSIVIPAFGFFLGIFGLVISIVARKEIANTAERGDRLAKSGIGLSIAGIVVQVFLTVAGIVSLFQAPPA